MAGHTISGKFTVEYFYMKIVCAKTFSSARGLRGADKNFLTMNYFEVKVLSIYSVHYCILCVHYISSTKS